jgi:hypothetical protein
MVSWNRRRKKKITGQQLPFFLIRTFNSLSLYIEKEENKTQHTQKKLVNEKETRSLGSCVLEENGLGLG